MDFKVGQIVVIIDDRNGDENGPYSTVAKHQNYARLMGKKVRITSVGKFQAYDIEHVDKVPPGAPRSAYPWRMKPETPEDPDIETDF